MKNGFINNFSKVCKVSTIISQVCQIRRLDWLEQDLLEQWEKRANKQIKTDDEVAFICAKYDFVEYLEQHFMKDEPIIMFLADTIRRV